MLSIGPQCHHDHPARDPRTLASSRLSSVLALEISLSWRPTEAKLRALIRRMSAENPLWGAPRIHGELLKLGFEVAQSSVANGMDRPCSRPQRHAEPVGGFEEHEEDTPCPAKQTLQSHAPLVSIPVRTRCISSAWMREAQSFYAKRSLGPGLPRDL